MKGVFRRLEALLNSISGVTAFEHDYESFAPTCFALRCVSGIWSLHVCARGCVLVCVCSCVCSCVVCSIIRYNHHVADGVSNEFARQGVNMVPSTRVPVRANQVWSLYQAVCRNGCVCVSVYMRAGAEIVRVSVRWLIIRAAVIAHTEESMDCSNRASFACESVPVVPPTLCDNGRTVSTEEINCILLQFTTECCECCECCECFMFCECVWVFRGSIGNVFVLMEQVT
jgi:hypothetical protein